MMKIKRKGLWTVAAVLVLALGTFGIVRSMIGKSTPTYQFGTASKGNLESTISATGTLTPLVTIDVGTQVSATIDTVLVDYNDTVKAGQVLAVMDTTLLSASVADAEANVQRCEAALEQAQYNYNLNKSLYNRGMTSQADSVPTAVEFKSQSAALKSAKIALTRAKRNLEYAVICAPISGIVIEKNTEAGQTVAANFSTPTLFVIAKDLSRMRILAQVDESDIGQIKVGQQVRFEVTTYSDKQFTGEVKQIRLQPATVSNVVTYTVVVEADNVEGFLLPGMTATIDFITDTRSDVLLIPAKALKFQPSADQIKEAMANAPKPPQGAGGPGQPSSGDSTMRPSTFAGSNNSESANNSTQSMGMVWYLNDQGQLSPAPVLLGMSDGTNTEVLRSPVLTDGMKVIVGSGTATTTTKKTTTNAGGPGGGPGGPPPGF